VLTCSGAPADRRAALEPVADVIAVGDATVDVRAAVAALRERGLGQLLCEGGPHLFGALTAADLVDELCLTLSPLLAGPGAGRITAGSASSVRRMALRSVLTADGMLLLRYARTRGEP
jgi:riboflavin biosynthesis pyrimidine reductase